MAGWLDRLKKGLTKTREILNTDIEDLFKGGQKLDGSTLEQLEEILITADVGVQTTMTLIERVSKAKVSDAQGVKDVLKKEILSLMTSTKTPEKPLAKPHIMMIVGVNGVGKTTTIGKLAAKFSSEGKKVLIAAADTFRAAAIEQISIWAERAGVDIVKHKDNADPAAVAFDGVEAAIARGKDIVIVDTAGRLHTRVNLMEEVKKIRRAIAKRLPDAPHEVLLVLDATTGQNAISQAKQFHEDLGVTGLILTKLDGTAKGGVVVSITNSLNIPLRYIGVGEGIDDLQEFDAAQFVEAMF
jgi:fused signal recognition particle receptor